MGKIYVERTNFPKSGASVMERVRARGRVILSQYVTLSGRFIFGANVTIL